MKQLARILRFAAPVLLCQCSGEMSGPDPRPEEAPQYSVLHKFHGAADGANPYGLIWDGAGNLYGTTYSGGNLACPDAVNGCGTVFKLDSSGALTTLHVFAGGPTDGASPQDGLIRDAAGNIYGATFRGGANNGGVVFRLDAAGRETVLYDFTGGADGSVPQLGVRDAAGNLYGTTGSNAALVRCRSNCGTVFKLDPTGTLTTLHVFNGADGDSPSGPIIRDSAGNLYGTTAYGGDSPTCIHHLGCGTVFKLDPAGVFTTLHVFTGEITEEEGDVPSGRLLLDETGNLYGTTIGGGSHLGGTVFKLEPNGRLTEMLAFVGGDFGEKEDTPGGKNPQAGVIRGRRGFLYGTTYRGGASKWGVLFLLTPVSHQQIVLHTFTQAGGAPLGPLVVDSAGNIYGTGFYGGNLTCPSGGCGIVFKFRLQ